MALTGSSHPLPSTPAFSTAYSARYHPPFRLLVVGLLWIMAAAGSSWFYYWITTTDVSDSKSRGNQFFLILCAPLAVLWILHAFGTGLRSLWNGLKQYKLSPQGVSVRTPLGRRRTLNWTDIRDFALPPGPFPRPPEKLLLIPREGSALSLPLSLIPKDDLHARLPEWFTPLAEHPLDQVYSSAASPVPSLPHTRWRYCRYDFPALYGGILFTLLGVLGGLACGYDYINYLRLRDNHFTAQARIVKIEQGDRSVHLRLEYTSAAGREYRLRSEVPTRFSQTHHVGDRVTVEYLPHRPGIGRVKGWDLDGRSWLMMFFCLPFAWIGFSLLGRFANGWMRPLRRRFGWKVISGEQFALFQLAGAGLEALYAMFPEQHQGAMAIWRLSAAKPGQTFSLEAPRLARWLRRSGIDGTLHEKKFVCLNRDEAAKLLRRFGQEQTMRGTYMVCDDPGPEQTITENAVLFDQLRLLLPIAGDREAAQNSLPTLSEHYRFFYIHSVARIQGLSGPAKKEDLPSIFEKWIGYQLRFLYEFSPPSNLLNTNFSRLFQVRPGDEAFALMAERRRSALRLWLWDQSSPAASCAQYTGQGWSVRHALPIPRAMRPKRGRWMRLVAGPLILIPLAITLLVGLAFQIKRRWKRRASS